MDRQTLAQEITQYLTEQGAVRVGFADLHGVTGASLPCCGPMAIRPRPTRRSICPPVLRIALPCPTRRWPAGPGWAGSEKITS